MAMLPQSNARLLSVLRGGFSEDYDRPADTAPAVWTGDLDAYVQQKIRSNFNDRGGLERVVDTTLFISGDLPVEIQAGDVVTYIAGNSDAAPVTMKGRVQHFVNPAFLPELPDYYKCSLEEVSII